MRYEGRSVARDMNKKTGQGAESLDSPWNPYPVRQAIDRKGLERESRSRVESDLVLLREGQE